MMCSLWGRARLEQAITVLTPTRDLELEDSKFSAGSSDNNYQWDEGVLAARVSDEDARPTLTINKLPQHIKQVTNDALQNPLAGKVVPADGEGDPEIAEIYQGVIRQIEADSDADVAISTANENQVTFGEGYFRILTEFVDSKSFDQKIVIGRIRNSVLGLYGHERAGWRPLRGSGARSLRRSARLSTARSTRRPRLSRS